MKKSIALCTYNGEKYLAEQLKSIAEQTIIIDEVIICDDRSSDNTVKIIESYQALGLPIILHINDERLGFIKNFEKATSLCSGDIIFLCDQDDIWLPHKAATVLNVFQQNNETILIFTDAQLIDENAKELPNTLWECVNLTTKSKVDFLDLLNNTRITGATVAFRRALLDIAIPIPSDWIHDTWFGIVAAAIGRIQAIPEKLILYRQHSNNQIGIRKITIKLLVDKIIRLATHTHTESSNRYLPLLKCLKSQSIVQQHLIGKMQHLDARQPKDGKKISILKGIFHEIRNKRYFIYAYGWNSIFRDIILLGYQILRRIQPPSAAK